MTFQRAVTNRLSESAKKLSALNVSGSFYADNAAYVIENSEFWPDDTSFKQIAFTGPVFLQILSVPLNPDDDLDAMEFVFAAKMQSGGQITLTLNDSSGNVASVATIDSFQVTPQIATPSSIGLNDLSWRIFRSSQLFVDKENLSAPRMDITVDISPNEGTDVVYFANPILSRVLDHGYNSEAARQMSSILPSFFRSGDGTENPPGAITRFIDVAFSGLDVAVRHQRDYRFLSFAEGRDESDPATLSELVWPSNAGLEEVKWLAQFTGTEPVSKLSSSIDPSEPFVLGTSLLNSSDSLRFSTTGANEPPVATVEVTLEFLRWQAEYGYYGINAGSMASVRESVKRVMTQPREVNIVPQHDGPFTVLVQTPWEQTYGASESDIGQPSSVVLEAISRARPIGVKISHELT